MARDRQVHFLIVGVIYINVGTPPIYSIYQFLTLFRLAVVSWRRSALCETGAHYLRQIERQ